MVRRMIAILHYGAQQALVVLVAHTHNITDSAEGRRRLTFPGECGQQRTGEEAIKQIKVKSFIFITFTTVLMGHCCCCCCWLL